MNRPSIATVFVSSCQTKPSIPAILGMLALILMLQARSQAATYSWTGSTSNTWNTSATNWNTTGTPWVSGSNHTALFGSNLTSGTSITISGSVFIGGITANQSLTLTNDTGVSSGINGSTVTIAIAAGQTLTIAADTTSTATWSVNGSGTLRWSGGNTINSLLVVGNNATGRVEQIGGVTLGAATDVFRIGMATNGVANGSYAITSGTLDIPGVVGIKLAELRAAGASGTATGTLVVNGADVFVKAPYQIVVGVEASSAASAFASATLDFREGAVATNKIAPSISSGQSAKVARQFLLGGSTGSASLQPWNGSLSIGGTTAETQLSVTLTGNNASLASTAASNGAAQTITVFNPIGESGGSYGLTFAGVGKTTLTAANTYTGSTVISGGTLALDSSGSFENSSIIRVGSAGSSSAVLDLTAKSGTFTFGSNQTVAGIGRINFGAGKTVASQGIWAPGNSIGSNTVTGNLALSGTSEFELGTPGTSSTSPGTSDFTSVSGTLTLGGNLALLDNSGSNSQGSYGAGSYRLFTAPALSGTFASVTAPAGAATTRVAMVYTSGTSSGQGVFANVYNLAAGSVTSGTTVNLGLIHAGGSFTASTLAIANTAANNGFSEGLNASVSGSTGNATFGGTNITNLAAGGTTSTITVSLGDTASGGVKTGSVTIGYQSNGSTTSGLSAISAGSQVVSLTGSVFSGTATWNVVGGGAWGSGASSSWTSTGGVTAAPGTFAGYTTTDVAILAGAQSGTSTILFDGATPSLAALVFSNTTGRYVLEQGSGGSLTLATSSGKPTIDVLAGGLHEVKTAILGSNGLEKIGGGALVLSGSSGFTGGTELSAGTLSVNGFVGGAVDVASGATLAGSGQVGGLVTVAAGGIIAPGNSPGTLTMDAGLSLADAAILNFELSGTNFTNGGGINDLIAVTGDLTLDGILNVAAIGGGDFTGVENGATWTLFTYSGSLTNNGMSLNSMPSLGDGRSYAIDTSTTGVVNLVIVPEPGAMLLAVVGAAGAIACSMRRRPSEASL